MKTRIASIILCAILTMQNSVRAQETTSSTCQPPDCYDVTLSSVTDISDLKVISKSPTGSKGCPWNATFNNLGTTAVKNYLNDPNNKHQVQNCATPCSCGSQTTIDPTQAGTYTGTATATLTHPPTDYDCTITFQYTMKYSAGTTGHYGTCASS